LITAWRTFRDDPELYVAILTGFRRPGVLCGSRSKQWRLALHGGSQNSTTDRPGILGPSRWTNITNPSLLLLWCWFAGG
jgi:hypothetical protein